MTKTDNSFGLKVSDDATETRCDKIKTRYIEDTMTNELPQYSIAKTGNQADGYTKTTHAIGDHVGQVYRHEIKMLVYCSWKRLHGLDQLSRKKPLDKKY